MLATIGTTGEAALPPLLNNCMKIIEVVTSPKAPLTPTQARLKQLQKNQEIAKQALAREKHQQQLKKAQERVSRLNTSKTKQLSTQIGARS